MANRVGKRLGLFERTIETAERDREIAFYKQGRTYKATAEHFDMSTSSVFEACERAMKDARRPAGEAMIAAELIKLDLLEQAALEVLRAEHIFVSDGRVVKDDEHTITDHKPVLMAIDRLLKISERRAKLLGLDAPTRQTVTVVTQDVIDAEIARLNEQLAELDSAEPS